MDDGPENIKIFQHHFRPSTENSNFHTKTNPSLRSHSQSWTRQKIRTAVSMLSLFSLRGLSWGSSNDDPNKVELIKLESESLRSELAGLEEREAHLKAQVEHLDEILRSARLSGYLYIRSRWEALPGESPPIDDADVDDSIQRFIVLQGSCIFFYLVSTDLSPLDSTLLSEVVEVGSLPSFTRENEQTRHAFYILTCHGLRYECSSFSKEQVDAWLNSLQVDCNFTHALPSCNDNCTWI